MPTKQANTTSDIPAGYGFVQRKCRVCDVQIDPRRVVLEKTTCIDCQADIDKAEPVKHLVAIPYNKGAYQYIHDPRDLFQTNPKQPR